MCGTWYNKFNYLYLQAVCEETCGEPGIRNTRFRRKNDVTQNGRDVDMSGLLKKWGLFSYPLKRTKQETYFRKHWDVHFCCSYIRMTPPGSGLLSPYIYIYIYGESIYILSLFIYFYLYSKLLHQLKTNTTSTLQLNCKWANYSGHQDIELIFAVDLRLSSTFLLLKSVCCCFLVSRERKLVLFKSNIILLD